MENKRSKIDDVGNEVILTSLKNGPTSWGHFTFYGIEFIYETPYVREKIEGYVDKVLLADSTNIV